MKKSIKIMILFLSFSYIAQSQTAIKSRGDKAYNEKDYVNAITEYNKTSEQDKLNKEQLLNLADSYYNIKDYKGASENYMTHIYNGGNLSLTEYNQYLQSLIQANYSKTIITEAINNRLNSLPQSIIKRYNNLIEDQKREKPFSRTTTSYKVENLDINSSSSDFGIFIFPDQTVMYSSSKENKVYNNIYKKINQPFINIYKSKISNKNNIDTLTIEKYVEKSMMHSSSPFFDELYNRLFYTQSEKQNNKLKFKKSKSNFRIVYGFIDNEKNLEKEYYFPKETNGYSYGHPYFDKETKRLYFVSDMPGGFGGTDIYYVEMNSEGITSEPVNLGEKINSFGNEMFPRIISNQLYFSSDLFIGKGGLDIYSSKITGNNYDYPVLLDSPINSTEDDFAFQVIQINENEKKGYFSSNRDNGKGSDDIYAFTETKTIKKIEISGFSKQKGENNIIIPNATVNISDTKGSLIDTFKTDQLGVYNVLLPIDKDYLFVVEKEGYVSTSETILLNNINNVDPIAKDFYLTKELVEDIYGNIKINLEPVYFEFDDASITPRAEMQLQFAIDYLNKYPDDKFKLEAHTDSRGKKTYNLTLSNKRAESVYNYLLSKGISSDRIISTKGYGETKLINECKDNVECTDEEHEQNRRTDFIIIRASNTK